MMKKPLIKRNELTICLTLCAVMIMSCSNSYTFPADIPHETPSTEIAISPSLTPSATPVPTSTALSTDTPTMVPSSTWTPLPTYSVNQARAKIKELLETNGGCNLPCWWGISPNKTLWSEALHFLNPLVLNVRQGSTQYYSYNGKKHSGMSATVDIEVPDIPQQGRIDFGVQDGIVIGMSVFPRVTEYGYQIHELLALLGLPKQIFINAQSSSPISELPPTVLTLDYSDVGVWASYGYIPSTDGKFLVICPKPLKQTKTIIDYENLGGRLELFDPTDKNDRRFSIEEYAEMWGGFTPKKLEEVTDMTTESFYSTFIRPKSGACLKTPSDLWP